MLPSLVHARARSPSTLFLSLLLGAGLDSAWAVPITFDVMGKGEKVGEVEIDTIMSEGNEGVGGTFDVTKKNANGSTMTVAELERFLGQDHLNWFQKVVSVDPDIPGVTDPFIDLPSGGLGETWADDRPWYLDEVRPPNPLPPGKTRSRDLQLADFVRGSRLAYGDIPGDQPVGTTASFATFLVSDFGNKTYSILGGFTWAIKILPNGKTDVTSLKKGAVFTKEFAKEIKDGFRYRQVPESGSLVLLVAGLVGLLRGRYRRTTRFPPTDT